MATSDIAPPVVRLGRIAGWHPLPLSVRDARRRAQPLRDRLEGSRRPTPPAPGGDRALRADGVVVRYQDTIAVREVSLDLAAGEVVALMGRNGSGKSSLLWALQGHGGRDRGTVTVEGTGPAARPADRGPGPVGLVPQTPADLLYLTTVDAELAEADRESGAATGTARHLLDRIVPEIRGDHHPRDLSEGQRLGVVLAVVLARHPRVVLLDEPTRGLDYGAKDRLAAVIGDLAAEGRAVVVATHDVEFVATVAHRVVVLADGEVVADGPTAEVVVASPSFSPQVAKILAPSDWLTPAEVADALAGAAPGAAP